VHCRTAAARQARHESSTVHSQQKDLGPTGSMALRSAVEPLSPASPISACIVSATRSNATLSAPKPSCIPRDPASFPTPLTPARALARLVARPAATVLLAILLPTLVAAYCPNACSGNGLCESNGLYCKCFTGFTGPDCSQRSCPAWKAWADSPNNTDTAHADYTECSNMGECNRMTGRCRCEVGFWGDACQYMVCPGFLKGQECSGHGLCVSMEEAAERKDDVSLFRETTYQNVWDHDMIRGCACDYGWEGFDCSLKSCPRGDDPVTTGQVNEVQVRRGAPAGLKERVICGGLCTCLNHVQCLPCGPLLSCHCILWLLSCSAVVVAASVIFSYNSTRALFPRKLILEAFSTFICTSVPNFCAGRRVSLSGYMLGQLLCEPLWSDNGKPLTTGAGPGYEDGAGKSLEDPSCKR
jgi:hypothetical protein